MLDARRSAKEFEDALGQVKVKLIEAGLSDDADLIAFLSAIAGECIRCAGHVCTPMPLNVCKPIPRNVCTPMPLNVLTKTIKRALVPVFCLCVCVCIVQMH
jgi:hypothetical protein